MTTSATLGSRKPCATHPTRMLMRHHCSATRSCAKRGRQWCALRRPVRRRAGERLLVCLEQLPLPQRSAFLLHHDDGLALDEVASALEVGFETAKTRLRYAMKKLRTCMGAYLAPVLANSGCDAP